MKVGCKGRVVVSMLGRTPVTLGEAAASQHSQLAGLFTRGKHQVTKQPCRSVLAVKVRWSAVRLIGRQHLHSSLLLIRETLKYQ